MLNRLYIGNKQGEIHFFLIDSSLLRPELNDGKSRPLKVSKNYVRMLKLNSDRSKLIAVCHNSEVSVIPTDQLEVVDASPKIIRLRGHTNAAMWVDCSSKNADLLITTGYDSTVRVWDLTKNVFKTQREGVDGAETTVVQPTDRYEFSTRLKYAIFSPLDEDCVIVGSQNTPFYVFNQTKKSHAFPPKILNLQQPSRVEGNETKEGTTKDQRESKEAVTVSRGPKEIEVKKKEESSVLYLAKRECTKKALQCLKAMLDEREEGEVPAYLHQKIFSEDSDDVREYLFQEGKWSYGTQYNTFN